MSKSDSGPVSSKALKGLGVWFERQARVLPWRDEPTLYRVWISEIMLQQTQVATVVPYFERFTAAFPTVGKLAQAPEAEVLKLWAGLGYYSRARNIHRAAKLIVERGGFPQDRDGWLEIPGVGPYTAGAILSIALDQAVPILDGNVERVMSRLRRVMRPPASGGGDAAYKARLWELAGAAVEDGARAGVKPSRLNQALMELGATVCTPKKPACQLCPVVDDCHARQRGDVADFPPPKAKKQWVQVREELSCVVDEENERVLLRLRAPGEWRAGLWDLPQEVPSGVMARKGGELESRHVVTRHKITRLTRVYVLERSRGKLKAAEGAATGELRWVSMEDPEVAVGSALKKTLKELRKLAARA